MNVGFKIEKINQVWANFYGEEDRKHEHQQWRGRFNPLRSRFEKILGVSDTEKFIQGYLKELLSPLNFFYCDKIIFFASKGSKT